MKSTRGRFGRLAIGGAALVLVLGACGDDSPTSSDSTESPDTTSEDTEAPGTTDAPPETEAADTTDAATTDAPTTETATTVPRTTVPPSTVMPTLPTIPPRTTVEQTPETEPAFFDDFEDDTYGWTPEVLDDEYATGEIADGFLTFSQSASFIDTLEQGQVGTPVVVWPSSIEDGAESYTDLRIETQLVMTRGASAGLACGIDPTNEDPRFYSFTLSSAGIIAIQKYSADGTFDNLAAVPERPASSEPALPADPAYEYDAETLYTVTAECLLGEDASTLSLELDGELILTHEDTDDPIPFGIAGLQYSESSIVNAVEGFQPFGVVFDTFSLFDLNAGTGAPRGVGAFESECVDEADDLQDDKGNPLPGHDAKGTDLTQVNLSSDGDVMTVVWELAEAPPADVSDTQRGGVAWELYIYTGDGEVITIRVVQEGAEPVYAFADSNLTAKERVDIDAVSLSGTTVAVDVPLDEVEIPSEFEWEAYGYLSGFELDPCPGTGDNISVP